MAIFSLALCVKPLSLHWRHNDHDIVSNHQPHDCLLNRLFRRRSNKTSKIRVTGHCAGNSPGPVNSPHKWPVTRKMFPFDDVIMWWNRDMPDRNIAANQQLWHKLCRQDESVFWTRNISITCAMSVWRLTKKCNINFQVPKINSAWKILKHFVLITSHAVIELGQHWFR